MPTFEEIATIQDKDMPTIYKELTASTIAKALRGAPREVVDKFFGNMALPYSNMIKDEAGKLGEVSSEEVAAERLKVVKTIEALRAQGRIA